MSLFAMPAGERDLAKWQNAAASIDRVGQESRVTFVITGVCAMMASFWVMSF